MIDSQKWLFWALPRPLIVAVATAVAGCGLTSAQRDAINSFSGSASALGQTAASEFERMPGTAQQITIAYYEQSSPEATAGIRNGSYRNLIDQFTSDRIALRVQLAQNLQKFGTLINQLATTSYEDKLNASANDLATSVKALPADLKFIGDSNADAIKQAVEAVGGIYIEYKRKKAVITVINQYLPQLTQSCSFIRNDFDITQSKLGEEMNRVNGNLLVSSISTLDKNPSSLTVRSSSMPGYALGYQTKAHIDTVYPGIVKAGDKCISASHALSKAMESEQFSLADIEAFAQQVQQLVAAAQSFK